ncbi:restriction endonuclease [Streptomyces sp. NPDC051172]|uniref:restriction endonuclease n=1 Tax=Streptomyces sp. NPDC051172 TaxID=3155796 RepID=UPI003440DC4B
MLYDPRGLIEAELPLDRAPHEALVTAVLAWKSPDLEPRDYEQIALQLTGHARAVAADVRRHAAALPKSDGRGALAEVVLREADRCLSVPLEGTARCVQNRARLVRALYTRLDPSPNPSRPLRSPRWCPARPPARGAAGRVPPLWNST